MSKINILRNVELISIKKSKIFIALIRVRSIIENNNSNNKTNKFKNIMSYKGVEFCSNVRWTYVVNRLAVLINHRLAVLI